MRPTSVLSAAVRLGPSGLCALRPAKGTIPVVKVYVSSLRTPLTLLCTACMASLFGGNFGSQPRRFTVPATAPPAVTAPATLAQTSITGAKTLTTGAAAGLTQRGMDNRRYSSVPDIGRHFDTHAFVTRLESQGLTREQAEVLVASLNEVISDSVQNMMTNVATKAEQEKTVYTYKVDFAALKGEIQMQEKNEYAMLKSENERLVGEVEKLKQKLREEITRTQAGVRLDISLFRGASRDEASVHELKIKETDARVQADISDLRTEMERVKYSVLSGLIGTITGAGALFLAYMRVFQH